MIRKITALLILVLAALFITPSVTYASNIDEAIEFYERVENAESKSKDAGLQLANKIWITENINPEYALKFMYKWMIWNNDNPYIDDLSNDDVSLTYEIKDSYLYCYFKAGIGQNTYTRVSSIQTIKGINNAEYIISSTSYDCYTICVDGDTYQGDLGVLLEDAIKQKKSYYQYPEISMPYDKCTDIYKLNGWINLYQNNEGDKENILNTQGYVGFNLTNDDFIPVVNDPVDDDYIYGGDENNKLDPTPTQPTTQAEFNPGVIIGYALSAIILIIMVYVIYVIIKNFIKIYKK